MSEYLLRFVQWTKVKIRLHTQERRIYYKEREIWWASLGANIGFEQDGKHEQFERPVLILKKFGGETLWILPVTSKDKSGLFYYPVEYDGKRFQVILSQLRLVSRKRLLRKIRTLGMDEFMEIKEKIKNLI